jgi:indole-3-glycerol phosphate synthase
MSGVLRAIVTSKKAEIPALAPRSSGLSPRGSLVASRLARPGRSDGPLPLRLITEIKRRSPSAGPLSTALSVAERAIAYARGGASMISVLADAPFFDGSWDHVAEARRAVDELGVPILAKEFVIDERQLEVAAAAGADAILLIARIVDRETLRRLFARATALGLEPLVEVVSTQEVDAALHAGARVIGVNARDLDTLVMDAARAATVLAAIPDDRIAVHLSGLRSPADVAEVAGRAVDAALMGEALMRVDDPTELLRAMVAATG